MSFVGHQLELASKNVQDVDFLELLPGEVVKINILASLKLVHLRYVRATCKRFKMVCDRILDLYIDDFADGLTALACYFNFLRCVPNRKQNERYVSIQIEFTTPTGYKAALYGVRTKVAEIKHVKGGQIERGQVEGEPTTVTNEIQLCSEIKQIVRQYPANRWEIRQDLDNTCVTEKSRIPYHMLTSLFPTVLQKETEYMKEHMPLWWFTLIDWTIKRLNPFMWARDAKDRMIRKFLNPYWFETQELALGTIRNRRTCGWNSTLRGKGSCLTSDVCLACYFDCLKTTSILKSCRTENTCLLCTEKQVYSCLLCTKHLRPQDTKITPLIEHVKQFSETTGLNRRLPTHLELVGWNILVKYGKFNLYDEFGTLHLFYKNPKFESDQVFVEYKMIFNEDNDL